MPINFGFTGDFGEWRPSPIGPIQHSGVDIPAEQSGLLFSPLSGIVTSVSNDPLGYGRNLIIQSGNRLVRLAHLQSVNVREGDKISASALIGTTGCSGVCTGPHVHYEEIRQTARGYVYLQPPDREIQLSGAVGGGHQLGPLDFIPPLDLLPNIPNPFSLFTDGIDAVGDFIDFGGNLLGLLASPRLWIRLAATLIAIIMFVVGTNSLSGSLTGLRVG